MQKYRRPRFKDAHLKSTPFFKDDIFSKSKVPRRYTIIIVGIILGSLCVSVLLYMFPVFFSWGSPSFQIFSVLCLCVVSGASGSVLSLLVHSV